MYKNCAIMITMVVTYRVTMSYSIMSYYSIYVTLDNTFSVSY